MALLETHYIKKKYGDREVVRGVNITVNKGEIVGLLGPNGAGKTTTFYMATGLIPVDSGKILFDHRDVTHLPMYKRAHYGIGYLLQEPSVFRGLTVEQNIMAILETLNLSYRERKKRLEELLRELHIQHR